MIKKKIFGLILFCTASVLLAIGFFNKRNFNSHLQKEIKLNMLNDNKKNWVKVDSLIDIGLTESAREYVKQIYLEAKNENNTTQYIKSVLYLLRLSSEKEEEATQKAISFLNEEIADAKFPAKPLLQSLQAEVSWQYYQDNRFKFYERSTTVNFNNNDISTWSLKQLLDFCIKNYTASIQNSTGLQSVKIEDYAYILTKGSSETIKLRPTLFDFLAHRAVDFLKNSESDINKPQNGFSLNAEIYLKNYEEFSQTTIKNENDSLNLKFYALQLFQQLIQFHEKDKSPEALIDIDIDRLNFIHSQSAHHLKDSLYLNSLHFIAEKFKTNPESGMASFNIAQFYNVLGSSYKPFEDDLLKWNRKKAFSIAEEVIKKFPASYAAQFCKNLTNEINFKTLNLNIEHTNEPGKPFRGLVTYRNCNKVYFRIIKLNYQNDVQLRKEHWGDRLINQYKALKSEKTFEYTLPNDGDYNEHKVEIKIPELPNAYYVILASTSPAFDYHKNTVTYAACWVSNIAYTYRRMNDGSYDFYVVHRQTGEALKGAQLQLWMDKYDPKTRSYIREKGEILSCDENGFTNIKHQTNERNNNFFIDITSGNDCINSESTFYTYKPYENEVQTSRTFFFTDRSIYRPGQTVYFKGIRIVSSGKENTLQTNTPITVSLFDVNGEKQHELKLNTNEFGTIAGSFVLPNNILNGQMNINDGQGSIYFSVEEYKRPKFEVFFNATKGAYRIGDEVLVAGKAKAFAGNSNDGAEVKYRVLRKINYPHRMYWRMSNFPNSVETEITNGVTLTNDTGGFSLKFKALPDLAIPEKNEPIYTYTVIADVTDLNGETRSAQTDVVIAYKALKINLTADDVIDMETLKPFKVSIVNYNNVEETTDGNLCIYKLKQPEKVYRSRQWEQADKYIFTKTEYENLFPIDLYADENNKLKWEKTLKVASQNFNSGKQKEVDLSTFLKSQTPGVYLLEATCKDKHGEEVKTMQFFTLYEKGSNTSVPEKVNDWFYPIKNSGEPGETVSFIQGSSSTGNYLLEVEHDQKIVSKQMKQTSMNLVDIAIEESYRGNFVYHISFIKNNRFYTHSVLVEVPYTNKQLDIGFETFRDKLLPGQQEEWKITIKNKKGEKETAELLATMYDASLDMFKEHNWYFDIYSRYYSSLNWASNTGNQVGSYTYAEKLNESFPVKTREYYNLKYFGWDMGQPQRGMLFSTYNYAAAMPGENGGDGNSGTHGKEHLAAPKLMSKEKEEVRLDEVGIKTKSSLKKDNSNPSVIGTRSNFNETAFFYPQLHTNENGETVIKFTIPESLTRWKLLGFAHSKDLKSGLIEKELITQKKLMVQPNAPRYFRENDKITFTSKVVNLSEENLTGQAELHLFDALSGKPLDAEFSNTMPQQTLSLNNGQSSAISWNLTIPSGLEAITYKITAKAGNHSDGEEMIIPVLSNSMVVTESMPFFINGKQEKEMDFVRFTNQNNHSSTLKNRAFTLEFTNNPAWYALQSLPYLDEYPYQCAEQTFSRYYANSIGAYIVNTAPAVKKVFDSWKLNNQDAFLSNLQKNQELKNLLLEETPWVMEAKSESERKNRIALLFDLNKMASEQEIALNKLIKMQISNGAWPWFEGGPDDWFITQHILSGLNHLDKLKVLKLRENPRVWKMMNAGITYCDNRMIELYQRIRALDKDFEKTNQLSPLMVQYLYTRSYVQDIPLSNECKQVIAFVKKQMELHWLKHNHYMQGMMALALNRFNEKNMAVRILQSLKENSLYNEEMGMYWKENYMNGSWNEAPIEGQALLIEAFDEINDDKNSVDKMKLWLIKSKQTQNWKTTKATCEAIYALLLKGTDWLSVETNSEIKIGHVKLDFQKDLTLKSEAGSGYFKKTFMGNEISTQLGKIKIKKKDEGPSWGALYWQYFEQLDKITTSKTAGLSIEKRLFVQRITNAGLIIEPISETSLLKPGDKITVRIQITTDRDLEYVHLKDMRAACMEPLNVLSSYKWKDGLGYYESTKDASTNFFFSSINKGTYVFEYAMVISHYGNFSNGVANIQCLYAPEFNAHSEGIRVSIVK